MKSFAQSLTGVTVVIAALFIYMSISSNLRMTQTESYMQPASERESAFENIIASARRGDPGISLLDDEPIGLITEYSFITLTYELTNFSIMTAEWVEINAEPQIGDTLVLATQTIDLGPFQKALVSVVILARNLAPSTERSVRLSYYSMGRYITLTR
jgi:hypothetical protein